MRFGEFNELISETSEWPGSIGDSLHNSSRYLHLLALTGATQTQAQKEMLKKFRTDSGYLRHWTAPDGWRESDMTSDGLVPYLIALETYQMFDYADEMRCRVGGTWQVGNGEMPNPILIGLLTKSKVILNASLALHALISYLPFRWSDEKKRLTWEPNSSADFLNWAHACWHIDSLAFRLVSHERFMKKIRGYFEPEVNSAWLVELYEQASLGQRR